MRARHEVLDPAIAERYSQTFDPTTSLRAGDALPPGWEGLYFGFDAALGALRPDGSPAEDGVVPDIALPRRMYAGEDTTFHRPLRLGDVVTQQMHLARRVDKVGRSGPLIFVDIERQYLVDGTPAVTSTWKDVFLAPAAGPTPEPAVDPFGQPEMIAEWSAERRLDTRHLFRFSAITFNTHRVHYDQAYSREVEGLPNLLVHGPLTRLLVLDEVRQRHPGRSPWTCTFRTIAPIYVDQTFTIAAVEKKKRTRIEVVGPGGLPLARAEVTWSA